MAFYENTEDLSIKSASAELSINRFSLHSWVNKYGTGKRSRTNALQDKAQASNNSERIRPLEKENAKLSEERDILRKAAKYFVSSRRTGVLLPWVLRKLKSWTSSALML